MMKYLLPPVVALVAVVIYELGYWRGTQFERLNLLSRLHKFEARPQEVHQ